jgi:tetratricopeptide (TPR) repeat protein
VEQARVAMKGTGNWVGSDAHGLFRVQLLRSTRIGQSIEVEVEGVPGWLLYQPADGRVVVPEQPQTVTLKLLPKGSLRFLGSQGLASLLSRMMSEAKESARASPAVPLGSTPPPVDLKGPMQKWASEYGLSLEQVQTAVDKWAKEVLSRRQQDDEQVCLAHYSQKQLEQAALCFDELGQKDVQELERLKAQVLERTERAVRRFVKAADAYKLRYDFAAALAEYEKAARWAKRDGSPALWAEVQNLLGLRIGSLESVSRASHPASIWRRPSWPTAPRWRSIRKKTCRKTGPRPRTTWALRSGTKRAGRKGPRAPRCWRRPSWPTAPRWRSGRKKTCRRTGPMTQNNLGNALRDQASRTQGTEGTALLAQAVLAYRSALEVRTKKDLPQDWAMTQNNLGIALSDQASRTQGTEGTALLAQAVLAYRSALEVGRKKTCRKTGPRPRTTWAMRSGTKRAGRKGPRAPRCWRRPSWPTAPRWRSIRKKTCRKTGPMTQNNLGVALRDQAQRLPPDSPARKELLTQAVGVFRAALEIHTQTVFPIDWARAHMNLARACALLSDDRCAADSFANVLHVYPDWSEGYGEAYVRYHEKLFLFAEAYALNQAWLDRHPDDLAVWPNYIESHLTTGRLAEVSALLAKVFAKLSPAEQVPLLAIEVFALVGQGKPAEAASKRKALRTLIDAQPADFRLSWTFGGTRHFLQTDPRFSPHKAQLLALLSALEQPNRAAILSALDACCRDTIQQP